MNGFFWGLMLSDLVLILWRIFKKFWWIPVSLFLGDKIGTMMGEALHMTNFHIAILTWLFASLVCMILKFKIVDRLNQAA